MRNRGISAGAALVRWLGYLALWTALIGLDPSIGWSADSLPASRPV